MSATLREGHRVELTFETGKAAMAPIYYERFWSIKYPIVEKLA